MAASERVIVSHVVSSEAYSICDVWLAFYRSPCTCGHAACSASSTAAIKLAERICDNFKQSFRGVVGQGAGYEHRADGQQAGGMQNFSEGGGMKGGNLGSGMPVGGMGSGMQSGGMQGAGQGEHHHHPHGGQQGGGMQVLHQRLTCCSAQACL